MIPRNRVIWNEGLFIKPQHFQQQQRYNEYNINERFLSVGRYLYGISQLLINPEFLSFGRVAVDCVVGVMPDGTVFRIPQEDILPDALEIEDATLTGQIIYLAIPLKNESLLEVDWPSEKGTGRYSSRRQDVKDIQSIDGDTAPIEIASPHLRLMLEKEDRSAYASVAIAKIREKRTDGSVVLEPDFIPCHFDVSCSPQLHRCINEIAGLMKERAKGIAQRLGSSGQGAIADVSDFMLLQALNRLQPILQHLVGLKSLHPERLYETLSSICGELATFTDESRLSPELLGYNHDMPSDSFWQVIRNLRQSLSVVLEPRAVSIRLDHRKYGLMVATVNDTQLIENAEFILAVKADMPLEELRKLFSQQTKVSSVEKIRDLISHQLPGIPVISLPVAPRQLPYYSGYTYYRLDKSSNAWAMLKGSAGFAFHVAGAFEGLDLQFWAIRD
ncbi:type VI secretion system baseplate subunit TssK [Marinomonas primoryensis]|jgi:type VI secretion system protein ImpJ|uniref:type VI secretion system baseplate subunit TssK n=1 Tax=Marinomonas primoryensis TaxID=178399 RepID=UPI00370464EE|tara:strand:+ start:8744 stop:10078 length:1335 start_codon:yes stop_codon:yes gene_type:complete